MSSSIDDLFQSTLASAQKAWDALADPATLGNLHDLPAHLNSSFNSLLDKVTNNGQLADPRQWADQLGAAVSPAPPPVVAPPSSRTPAWLTAVARHAGEHPFAYTLTVVGLGGGTSYYLFPRQTLVALSPLSRLVPLSLLPDPKNRPLRLTPSSHGVAGEVRKEAVVVLGADSGVGREVALDLERRGFVVIATVTEPREVNVLEKLSRGWMKVLVLDPNESSSVSPFLRSLSTALSLRFPLHTSGDPFSRPAHALALTGVVNALSFSAAPETLAPLEAVENDVVRKLVGERIATVVGVTKGLLSILRTASSRPGAATGSFVNLVPSSSSNLALPFLALTSATSAALSSLFHSLRRELSASTSSSVSLTILETGFFNLPSSAFSVAAASSTVKLPIRLESVYAPALARRTPPVQVQDEKTRVKCKGRSGSAVKRLSKRVFKILVRPANAGAVERIGAGSFTYPLLTYLPHTLIDLCLTIQDRLYGLYLSHLSKRFSAARLSSSSSTSAASPSTARPGRPLPTPPAPQQQQHPASLRPAASPTAASSVPVKDAFVSSPSPSADDEKHETGSQSSLEDFGPLGGSGMGSMSESWAEVGRDEGRGQ